MIRINLLPFRAAGKEEHARKQRNLCGLMVLFVFLAVTYFFMSLNSRVVDLWVKQKTKTAELDSHRGTDKQLKRIQARIGELKAKLESIKMLETSKTDPAFLLEEIARAVPNDQLWLRMISGKGGLLRVEGSAVDHDAVALLMTELEKTDPVLSVDLLNTKRREVSQYKRNVTDFALLCRTDSYKEPESQNTLKKREHRRARR